MSASVRRIVWFAAAVAGAAILACVDGTGPLNRAIIGTPGIHRNVTPCPDSMQDTVPGGWCATTEWPILDTIISNMYTGTAGCAAMQNALRSWLESGKIRRANLLSGLGDAYVDHDAEWNGGDRLGNMRIHAAILSPPRDWGSTLRHEFGHAWGNIQQADDASAEAYAEYCRTSSSGSPPPQPAGAQVYISYLPDSVSVGWDGQAQSTCQPSSAAVWSGSGSVSVTSSGHVTATDVGIPSVRVDCRGTHDEKWMAVHPAECALDPQQRLVGGGVLSSTPPLLDLTEEDCNGGQAPSPPSGGAGEDGEMDCYVITAHLYEWWGSQYGWVEVASWPVGYVCYLDGHMY